MWSEDIYTLATAVVVIAAIVSLAAVLMRRQQIIRDSMLQREQLFAKLTERFEDSAALVAFAASPQAARLFETMDGPTSVAKRLLALTAAAIVTGAAGIAFLINSLAPLPSPDINFVREAQFERWWAVMLLAVSIGLGMAVILCVRLARRWGLLAG